MTKEEDDLYADLYAEDTGADRSGNQDVDDAIYEEDVKTTGTALSKGGASTTSVPSSKSSFIPAANPSSSAPSSFIPADPSRSAVSSNVGSSSSHSGTAGNSSNAPRSYVSSASTTTYSSAPTSRIETAPMTNSDAGYKSSAMQMGGDQSYKQLLPHEMPDEG
jgi:hypothetical protein